MRELDLDKPIFLVKIATEHMSKQNAMQYYEDVSDYFRYSNITVWIMSTKDENDVKCIYDGKSKDNELLEELENIIEIHKKSNTFEEFKSIMREYKINKYLCI